MPQLHKSSLRRGSAVPLLIGAMLAALLLGLGLWFFFIRSDGTETDDAMTATVIEAPFIATVLDQGEVESSENVEFPCEVKGGTTIIFILPEGEMVRGPLVTLDYDDDPLLLASISPLYAIAFDKVVARHSPWQGDLLVTLDSAPLETQRTQQLISVNTAESIVSQAESALEGAEVAREEYLLGTFKQDEQMILNEIFEAEENLRKAEQYVVFSERLAARGFVTQLQLEADRFAVQKTQNALDLAKRKLEVLRNQTRKRMLIEFDANIRTAKVQWKNEQESLQVEVDKLADIDDQIAKCTIRVPQGVEGQVVHANMFSRRGGSEWVADEGAAVRERQEIIRLPNPELMQVKATVNESRVTKVSPGMPVMINLDALEDNKQLRGEVTKVNQYAEPSGFGGGGVKEYGVLVRIFDPPAEIRPGMNAAVKIITDERAMALQVPLQSVYEYRGHHFCLLKVGNEWETREVVISATNDTKAVVENGLAKGDEVVLSPRRYKDKMDLPDLPDPAARKNAPAARGSTDASASPSDARPTATPPKGPPNSAGQGGGGGQAGGPGR
jgi:HlyD family secretion protein